MSELDASQDLFDNNQDLFSDSSGPDQPYEVIVINDSDCPDRVSLFPESACRSCSELGIIISRDSDQ